MHIEYIPEVPMIYLLEMKPRGKSRAILSKSYRVPRHDDYTYSTTNCSTTKCVPTRELVMRTHNVDRNGNSSELQGY